MLVYGKKVTVRRRDPVEVTGGLVTVTPSTPDHWVGAPQPATDPLGPAE